MLVYLKIKKIKRDIIKRKFLFHRKDNFFKVFLHHNGLISKSFFLPRIIKFIHF